MQPKQWSQFISKVKNSTSQVYAPTTDAKEVEVERFYEDLQNLLELTPRKVVLFIIGDWNAKVGSKETPGVTGKFGLGIQNEAGQRLTEFCQENALVRANSSLCDAKSCMLVIGINGITSLLFSTWYLLPEIYTYYTFLTWH